MKISVEFPSVSYREGPARVVELARAIEAIGYDDLAMFDHVVMGHATETRRAPIYPSQMPILEALVTLGYVAAVTERIGLSTEVLVLPQRQAVLVAKQVSTLDTLSGGRVRLGVGVGWQETEYDALGEDFADRGARMDETIGLLRSCWGDERIERKGARFHADAIAMEPKPPQGAGLPVWIGGSAPAALRRTGQLGDGWMGSATGDDERDRAAQKTTSFTGIVGISEQDAAIQDSQGFIADRTRENLGPTDLGIIRFRRLVLDTAAALQQGTEPPAARRPGAYRVRSGGMVAPASCRVADVLTARFGSETGVVTDA